MRFKPGQKVKKQTKEGWLEATVIHSAPPEKGRKRVVVVVGDEGAEVWYEDECVKVSLDQEAEQAVNDGANQGA